LTNPAAQPSDPRRRQARIEELPYRPDSAPLFEPLATAPWGVFLDSARTRGGDGGRYDILTADPFLTLVTRGERSEFRGPRGVGLSPQDPFTLLRTVLGPRTGPCAAAGTEPLPFCGGALGWLGYDLARRIERLPVLAQDAEGLPDMAVGLYDWAVVVDHQAQRTWLVGAGHDPRTAARWSALRRHFSRPGRPLRPDRLRLSGPVRSNMTRSDYRQAFARIQAYLHAGDCYQVNLAQRFAVPAAGDPWPLYRRLRALNPAPFSAFLKTPYGRVLCSSPERFLALRDGCVETSPIKGTRPRAANPGADDALADDLRGSPKDRAENLMIVDLLRNDLGRVCSPGSIRVPELFAVKSYATVHHLVSTITGRLRPDEDAPSLLRACFPGGSITGAPKVRAMEIIEALEPHRRGVYCGSIGYIGFDGAMDTNIAIRTLVHSHGSLRFWAGGGIIYDSDAAQEYLETFDKAEAMLRVLGSTPADTVDRGTG
jgi:para-aminobenzoate synthetase component 1